MKLRHFVLAAASLGLLLGTTQTHSRAQQPAPPPNPLTEADQKIEAEVHDHNQLMSNLEYLADQLGPRLTGSPNLDAASHWTEQRFKDYGLENVHLEPWQIAHSWTRGYTQGRIVTPYVHNIAVASAGWSPSTNGVVRGPVVYVKTDKPEDLEQYKGKLKGAIVIVAEPGEYKAPEDPMLTPYGDDIIPINQSAKPRPRPSMRFYMSLFQFMPKEGVAAVLLSSEKPYGLLNMFSIGGPMYAKGPTPTMIASWEDYNLIWHLMQKGNVELELSADNSFSEKPVEVYNTIAEIKGSEKPDEFVYIGAHLDSWDLGTGATDNGTGSVVVMEAARALEKSGLKPKRTIRFALFTGEEQGLCGSRAYVEQHKDDLSKVSAILVHDTGTSKVISIGMMGDFPAREVMDKVVEPMHGLGLLEPSLRSLFGSDHNSFDSRGVPGFWAIQDVGDYNKTHHSQADTLDRANEEDLVQGAQVMAAWAYNVAQLPDLLPRKPAPPAPPPAATPAPAAQPKPADKPQR
jgi:carboxypeptidase Q